MFKKICLAAQMNFEQYDFSVFKRMTIEFQKSPITN